MKSHASTDTSLRGFVELASRAAEKLFNKRGQLLPMWHYIDRKGATHVMPAPPHGSKDFSVLVMRALFMLEGVTRCVFIDEAWIVDSRASPEADMDVAMRIGNLYGLRNHPNRQEVIMFSAEDQNEGHLMARRYIERPAGGGKPKLGPLIIDGPEGIMEGRLVGVLPPKSGERMQ